jgi:hypothetical protein
VAFGGVLFYYLEEMWESNRKDDAWAEGYREAERQFFAYLDRGLVPAFYNPFPKGTEEHDGFVEGAYVLTHKKGGES